MKYKNLFIFYLFLQLTSCKYFDPVITKDTTIIYLAKDNYFFFYFNNTKDLSIFCNKCNIIDKEKSKKDFSLTLRKLGSDSTYDYIRGHPSISIEFIDLKYKEQVIQKIAKKAKTEIKPQGNTIQKNVLKIYTNKILYFKVEESDDIYFLNLLKEIISNKSKTKIHIEKYGSSFLIPWE